MEGRLSRSTVSARIFIRAETCVPRRRACFRMSFLRAWTWVGGRRVVKMRVSCFEALEGSLANSSIRRRQVEYPRPLCQLISFWEKVCGGYGEYVRISSCHEHDGVILELVVGS